MVMVTVHRGNRYFSVTVFDCAFLKGLQPKPYLLSNVKYELSLTSNMLYNQDPTSQLYFSNCHYLFAPGKIFTCHF